MEELAEGRLLENAFEDPLFNVWSFLSVRDLVAASQASKEIGAKSIFGFIANEIFSGFHLPLVFDNSADYDLEQLILQLKRYHVPTKPRPSTQLDKPVTPRAPVTVDAGSEKKLAPPEDSDEEACMFLIEGHLESASFDEYDDFTPRHPVPKDKVHRRGDSYFNSDISEVARLATDRTVSAAVRKFANITLQTELEEDLPVIDMKAEVSPHIPTFRTDFTSSGNNKNRTSVFTFGN